ncbi:MAG TPA: M15 family metallopeptidase [Fimbriimonadaceae bacterium]|nr:M15 family metallopeptidase [Fimbriimonadaceae bacterium]
MSWDRSKGRPEPIAALNRIVEKDNGEPLVDIRKAVPKVRIFRKATIPYVRQTVAEMLKRAAASLPKGYYLSLTEGWRPLERQRLIYEFMSKSLLEVKPDIDYATLRRTINRWVAPVDQKAPPGHCTGAAVDVYLVDKKNEPYDVTSPFERFESGPTYVRGLSPAARRNRDLLLSTMLGVGFSNCRDEWWHYSYGDAGWAVRTGRKRCVYGLIELDESLFKEQQRLWVVERKKRKNPFKGNL